MQKYECIVVLRSGIPESESSAVLERFEKTVEQHGGEITLKEDWGTRKLAYEINKQSNGDYTLYRFTADNSLVVDADRDFRLDEKVLRHLLVVDEEWEERNRAALAKRAEYREREESGNGR